MRVNATEVREKRLEKNLRKEAKTGGGAGMRLEPGLSKKLLFVLLFSLSLSSLSRSSSSLGKRKKEQGKRSFFRPPFRPKSLASLGLLSPNCLLLLLLNTHQTNDEGLLLSTREKKTRRAKKVEKKKKAQDEIDTEKERRGGKKKEQLRSRDGTPEGQKKEFSFRSLSSPARNATRVPACVCHLLRSG